MKKLILFAAILFACGTVAKADGTGKNNVKIKLQLHPIMTIEVGGDTGGSDDGEEGLVNGEVLLNYNTDDDYTDGVSRKINNHIKVVSTQGYKVKVKADNANFGGGDNDLGVDNITVQAFSGETGSTAVTLSATDQVLASSDNATNAVTTFDVLYSGIGNNKLADYVKNETQTNYEVNVLYTITTD